MFPEYNSMSGMNFSTLKHIHTSPKHYRWRLENPEPPKTSYIIGNAIHTLVLEPDQFDSRYAVWNMLTKKGDKLTPRSGAALKEWLSLNPGCDPLLPEDYDRARRAADSVMGSWAGRELIAHCRHEEPMQWTDPDSGMKCKGRVDAIGPEYILDLKTTRSTSRRLFQNDMANYLYHCQIAYYETGARTLKKIPGDTMPWVVAVDTEGPFDVIFGQLKPEDLAAGRSACLQMMQRLEECLAADFWPGQNPDPIMFDLPGYAAGLGGSDEEW